MTRRRLLWMVGLLVGGVACCIVLAGLGLALTPPAFGDKDFFVRVDREVAERVHKMGGQPRPVSAQVNNLVVSLGLLPRLALGGSRLRVDFAAHGTGRLQTFSRSRFEVEPGSGRYMDMAIIARPRPEYRAPVFHMEIMAPMRGNPAAVLMDFYAMEPGQVEAAAFLGERTSTIKAALDRVAVYQRVEGRGRLSRHLDAHKSAFRVELRGPDPEDGAANERFHAEVQACVLAFLDGYLAALDHAEPQPGYAERHQNAFRAFMDNAAAKDPAVRLGRMIFSPAEMEQYFFVGMWGREG